MRNARPTCVSHGGHARYRRSPAAHPVARRPLTEREAARRPVVRVAVAAPAWDRPARPPGGAGAPCPRVRTSAARHARAGGSAATGAAVSLVGRSRPAARRLPGWAGSRSTGPARRRRSGACAPDSACAAAGSAGDSARRQTAGPGSRFAPLAGYAWHAGKADMSRPCLRRCSPPCLASACSPPPWRAGHTATSYRVARGSCCLGGVVLGLSFGFLPSRHDWTRRSSRGAVLGSRWPRGSR